MVDSVITMRQMRLGIGTAGLYKILFMSANSVAETVRERDPEFAILKTIGIGDPQLAQLVFLEAVGGSPSPRDERPSRRSDRIRHSDRRDGRGDGRGVAPLARPATR